MGTEMRLKYRVSQGWATKDLLAILLVLSVLVVCHDAAQATAAASASEPTASPTAVGKAPDWIPLFQALL